MQTPFRTELPAAVVLPLAVPWWRVGVMWLVVGGLGVVVVASFMLLATAVRYADTVVPYAAAKPALPGQPGSTATTEPSQKPAIQGRNHAATPAR